MALVKLRLQNLMMYRIGFFGPFFIDSSLFLVQILAFQAIYSHVDRIGSWEKGEMILFIGTFSMINAINMLVYFFGVIGIPGKIRSGELDLYLTKPVSPLLRLTFDWVNPGSFPLVILSGVIIYYGIQIGNMRITAGKIMAYLFWLVLMTVLYYEMEVLIRSLSFYIVSVDKLEMLEENGLSLCMQLPGTIFYGIYKVIFCCILPYGIMATIPVQSLVNELTPVKAVYGIAMIIVFSLLTWIVWKCGIKRYDSVSS